MSLPPGHPPPELDLLQPPLPPPRSLGPFPPHPQAPPPPGGIGERGSLYRHLVNRWLLRVETPPQHFPSSLCAVAAPALSPSAVGSACVEGHLPLPQARLRAELWGLGRACRCWLAGASTVAATRPSSFFFFWSFCIFFLGCFPGIWGVAGEGWN